MADPEFESLVRAFFGDGKMLFGHEGERIMELVKQGRYEEAKDILHTSNDRYAKHRMDLIDEMASSAKGQPFSKFSETVLLKTVYVLFFIDLSTR